MCLRWGRRRCASGHSYQHPNHHTNGHRHVNSYSRIDTHTDGNANINFYTHAHRYPNTHPDSESDLSADVDGHTLANHADQSRNERSGL